MLSCMHSRCICMKGLCHFAVKDPWSSKCIAEPYLPGAGIIPPSPYKLQTLSSQSRFCSADTLKISEKPGCPQIILTKQDIIFLMTATANNHSPASVCLSVHPDLLWHRALLSPGTPQHKPGCRTIPSWSCPPCTFHHCISSAAGSQGARQGLPSEQPAPEVIPIHPWPPDKGILLLLHNQPT